MLKKSLCISIIHKDFMNIRLRVLYDISTALILINKNSSLVIQSLGTRSIIMHKLFENSQRTAD
jgi:hypothetical protein